MSKNNKLAAKKHSSNAAKIVVLQDVPAQTVVAQDAPVHDASVKAEKVKVEKVKVEKAKIEKVKAEKAKIEKVKVEKVKTAKHESPAKQLPPVQFIIDLTTLRVLTTERASMLLDISERYIEDALRAGELRGRKRASRWFVTPDDLELWVKSGTKSKK